jgi:hypothetical protein
VTWMTGQYREAVATRGLSLRDGRDRQTLTRSLRLPVLTSSQIYSLRRTNVLIKSFKSFYIKYLVLLILSVVLLASAQDKKLPPDLCGSDDR